MLRKPQEGAHDPQTGRRSVCIYLSTICLSIYLFLRSSETGSLPGTEGAAWGQAGLGSRLWAVARLQLLPGQGDTSTPYTGKRCELLCQVHNPKLMRLEGFLALSYSWGAVVNGHFILHHIHSLHLNTLRSAFCVTFHTLLGLQEDIPFVTVLCQPVLVLSPLPVGVLQTKGELCVHHRTRLWPLWRSDSLSGIAKALHLYIKTMLSLVKCLVGKLLLFPLFFFFFP